MGCPAEKATSVQFCNVAHLNFDSTSNLLGGKACNHSNGLQSINYEGEVRELWNKGLHHIGMLEFASVSKKYFALLS